uniref:Transmembrane protein n=1 Tax=Nelumbo nucifera TaxID=4432 RepID=A0A822YZD0_NELNU|nr:TPA_asm: hypothetical protein HUJ06_006746 [Nelumbo nucifera]
MSHLSPPSQLAWMLTTSLSRIFMGSSSATKFDFNSITLLWTLLLLLLILHVLEAATPLTAVVVVPAMDVVPIMVVVVATVVVAADEVNPTTVESFVSYATGTGMLFSLVNGD